MPGGDEVQQYLTGAWRMMWGKRDGLGLLDLSADGFWNSFYAIVIAFPALIVGWVGLANDIVLFDDSFTSRFSLVLRLAVVDLGSWVLPILLFALVARRFGIGDRLVPYVVASNWASAIYIWMMAPPAVMRLFLPDTAELATLVSFGIFLFTLVLSWRLTNAAIGRGPMVATGVFTGMFAASLGVLALLEMMVGLL